MDVHVALADGRGCCGLTLEMPDGGTLPDVILVNDWVFSYEDINDKGWPVYRAVSAYATVPTHGKALPLRRTYHRRDELGP